MKIIKCLAAITLSIGWISNVSAMELTPPSQSEWVESKKYVQVNDQVKMAYVEWGDTEGDPVILIHGYSDNSRAFSDIAHYLDDKHYFAIDLRGHGNTSAPACCYYLGNLSEDVNDFMISMGIEKASVVGHSLGSITSGIFASLYPEKVDKLILISSALKLDEDVLSWLYNTVTTIDYPIDPKSNFIQNDWAPNPDGIEMLDYLQIEEAKMPKQAWVGLVKALEILDWSMAARHITAPTLLMWGDQDQLMLEGDQYELQKIIPHASYIKYEGLGHSMYWEDPKRASLDIVNFLN